MYGLRLFIVVLQELQCCLHVDIIRVICIYHLSFVWLHLLVSEIVLPEGVYCCHTRTTLFTTIFTVIIVVRLLKSMCIPSFVLIGCCVCELHAYSIYVPIVMYTLRLFIVVLQELHCLPKF